MSSIRRRVPPAAIWLIAAPLSLCGCQSHPKEPTQPAPPPVASADKIAAIRETIQKGQPGSLVGQVIAVSTEYGPYAAVADLPVQDVKVGQVITFLDADGNPINNGTVMAVVGDTLHVKYDPAGKRPVQTGDLAVWLKS
jgi:hypothetical protein